MLIFSFCADELPVRLAEVRHLAPERSIDFGPMLHLVRPKLKTEQHDGRLGFTGLRRMDEIVTEDDRFARHILILADSTRQLLVKQAKAAGIFRYRRHA